MITAEQMTKAMFVLEAGRVMKITDGQMPIWLDLITTAAPQAEYDDLMQAVRNIATRQSDRNEWITVADVLGEVRKVRRKSIELAERYARQIEAKGTNVTDINSRQIMADTRAGMTPAEVASRARSRAEEATK